MKTSNTGRPGRPGRILLVFSRATDAQNVSRCLTEAVDMDLTTVRDARVALSLLVAAGQRRFRAVLAESDLRGGSGLDLLSRAKSLDPNVTTVLLSCFPTEALDMHEMFFVDHHVPAGFSGERLCAEVLRALGLPLAPPRPVAGGGESASWNGPLPLLPNRWPFGENREAAARAMLPAPQASQQGPVSWGKDLETAVRPRRLA